MKRTYRIRMVPGGYIAERRVLFRFWTYLHVGSADWYTGDIYEPAATAFDTADEAESAIRTTIVRRGIRHAHCRVVRTMPPWTPATQAKEVEL